MDINELFNAKPAEKTIEPSKPGQRILSLVSFLNAKPLVYGLEKRIVQHDFILQKDVPSVCAQRLKEGEVDLGIIPSIEYAQSKGSWKIIPDLCISSKGAVKSVNLFFKKDLQDLNVIALDTSSRTSVALLKIILKEKFQIEPEYMFMAPDLNEMFKKADAALIIGDRALHYQAENPSHLDLGEEWYDLTGLPFVFALWAGHELSINKDDLEIVRQSYQAGKENLEEIAREFASVHPLAWDAYYDYLCKNVVYTFGEDEKEGLMEFYRYAFYFGLIKHIPELLFYERPS
ncbi:MAG: menaquinone biosynthesis protein [Calditrichaceae bacterium]|nr:menaquinone biosynthesis protein [Calditrichaceae bacterium]